MWPYNPCPNIYQHCVKFFNHIYTICLFKISLYIYGCISFQHFLSWPFHTTLTFIWGNSFILAMGPINL
jgi:hypothetical protein